MRCAGDPRILAGGPLIKLSRALGGERLEAFASADVGAALADRLLIAAAALLRVPPPQSAAMAAAAVAAGEPPRFAAAAAAAAALPGGRRFALATAPAATAAAAAAALPEGAAAFAAPTAGYIVETHTERGLCKLALDAHDTIVQGAYLGRETGITPDLLSALMNMPSALLAPELHQAVESGEVRLNPSLQVSAPHKTMLTARRKDHTHEALARIQHASTPAQAHALSHSLYAAGSGGWGVRNVATCHCLAHTRPAHLRLPIGGRPCRCRAWWSGCWRRGCGRR